MKRTIMLAIVLVLLSAGLVFAAGSKDVAPALAGTENLELVTLTGTIHQEIGRPVVFKSGNTSYNVMLPMMVLPEVSISQGESVSLQGYVIAPAAGAAAGTLPVIHVTRATLQGKEYVFVGGGRAGMAGMRGAMPQRGMQPGMTMPNAPRQDMWGRGGRSGNSQNN